MKWFPFEPDRRPLASRVCFVYEGMRVRGTLPDEEWTTYLDDALRKAKEQDDPEDFCWGLMIAMNLGGLDIPIEDRLELGVPAQAWSDTVNWNERERH